MAYLIAYKSVYNFLLKEENAIRDNVHEQNLSGSLMLHVDKKLSEFKSLKDYRVDNEYDRKQNGLVKTFLDSNYEVIRIRCDLIVHTRGLLVEQDNFIAFELKKSNRSENDKQKDKIRLRGLTKSREVYRAPGDEFNTHPEHVCGYLLGVYIEINNKENQVLLEFYENGERVSEKTIPLDNLMLKEYLNTKRYLLKK